MKMPTAGSLMVGVQVWARRTWAQIARGWLVVCVIVGGSGAAAPYPSRLAEADGQALAVELRGQVPVHESRSSGLLRLRDGRGKWQESIPVTLDVRIGESSWQTLYQALNPDRTPRETLIVTRSDGSPNRYDYIRSGEGDPRAGTAVTVYGEAAATPFAGSEFWLSDLGLEFLHWPEQRLVKSEMRKGRSCRVLESLNPAAGAQGYARVWSWIDLEHRALLRAEAYDAAGRLKKEFSIGSFRKVDGRWQLKSMEIRNEQTDARTRLEFDVAVD